MVVWTSEAARPSIHTPSSCRRLPARTALGRVALQAVDLAGFRVALGHIAKREDVRRIEEIQIRMRVPRRLGEAMIEAAAAAPGHVRHNPVEHLPMCLVLIEPVVQKSAEEASALRDAEGDGAAEGTGRQRKLVVASNLSMEIASRTAASPTPTTGGSCDR